MLKNTATTNAESATVTTRSNTEENTSLKPLKAIATYTHKKKYFTVHPADGAPPDPHHKIYVTLKILCP